MKGDVMTTKQGHTAGPWTISRITVGGHRVVTGRDGFDIVTVEGIGRIEEVQDANAALIAAAPELLEALKTVLADDGEAILPSTREIIEAVIAKAEGRA